ncbi:metallophosphoesterase family protein [Paraburkholderia youngii]|uniref:metallophosphoesterase family protein n=1 Tax=Paraburkholderia youngii TaxID=2782701 RepID=UPI001590539A|nr:metallophosphatase family protein [Paraburkholderia youngii]NUX58005.1 metallophosphatase family protein [Paraburkholderia youngii]
MKFAHFSDLHYAPDNLAESDRCFSFAVGNAIDSGARVGVISGDSTDHRLDAHAPSLHALATQIHRLANAMPVLMLQGTFSHEPPGTLDNFALMGGVHQIHVADRVSQVALVDGRFWASKGPVFSDDELRQFIGVMPEVVFTCLPTVNKGQLAASVGALEAGTGLGDVLAAYLAAAGRVNRQLRAAGIRTVGVSHGTVNGCTTEHGVTMAGFDHEFSLTALFEAECDGFMLGHIHKAQQWARDGRLVAYPGSIGRFHYGEVGEKGYLSWDVEPASASATLVATPSRQMICMDFDGPPDMAKLQELAADATDKFVRVRWQVDEEHRQVVDREAIKALFSGAAGLKVESRVLPVVRSRAQGISLETTVEGKLARWCELSSVDASLLQDRLQLLASGDVEAIAAGVLASLACGPESPPEMLPEVPALATVLTHPAASLETTDVVTAAPVGTDTKATATPASLDWLNDDLFAA